MTAKNSSSSPDRPMDNQNKALALWKKLANNKKFVMIDDSTGKVKDSSANKTSGSGSSPLNLTKSKSFMKKKDSFVMEGTPQLVKTKSSNAKAIMDQIGA